MSFPETYEYLTNQAFRIVAVMSISDLPIRECYKLMNMPVKQGFIVTFA